MDKKVTIAIIAVYAIVAILGSQFFISHSEGILIAADECISLPSDYTIENQTIAYNCDRDIGILFMPTGAKATEQKTFFNAIKSNGKDAGYKKVKTYEVNGYTVYEFSANPDKLKKVPSIRTEIGNYEVWKDFEPYLPYKDFSDMKVKKYRYVSYVKFNEVEELFIFTNNTDVDLYSSDIENIVNSISLVRT